VVLAEVASAAAAAAEAGKFYIMYRRDLLTAEIQRLAQALARIMGLKQQGKTEEVQNGLNEVFEKEFGIDFQDLLNINLPDFEVLLNLKEFPAEKLDLFSQFLYLTLNTGKPPAHDTAIALKLQWLYQTLEKKHHIINIINLDRQKTIQQYINSNS
jgi:hypothetical protein